MKKSETEIRQTLKFFMPKVACIITQVILLILHSKGIIAPPLSVLLIPTYIVFLDILGLCLALCFAWANIMKYNEHDKMRDECPKTPPTTGSNIEKPINKIEIHVTDEELQAFQEWLNKLEEGGQDEIDK